MVEQMVGFIDEEIAAGNWVTEQAVIMWYMEQVQAELQTEEEDLTRHALAQSMIEQMIHEKKVVVTEESPDPAVPELRKLERPGRRSNEQDDENLELAYLCSVNTSPTHHLLHSHPTHRTRVRSRFKKRWMRTSCVPRPTTRSPNELLRPRPNGTSVQLCRT